MSKRRNLHDHLGHQPQGRQRQNHHRHGVGHRSRTAQPATCPCWTPIRNGDATTWAGDAEDAGETLPFTVDSANIGKLKRLRKTMADDELVIIDCPPAGNVVDVACDVADFVIVPATQGHSN